jgi:hypothetical protein
MCSRAADGCGLGSEGTAYHCGGCGEAGGEMREAAQSRGEIGESVSGGTFDADLVEIVDVKSGWLASRRCKQLENRRWRKSTVT